MKLFKGNATVQSRKSPYSLYSEAYATFSKDEVYNQKDACGFIRLFGLSTAASKGRAQELLDAMDLADAGDRAIDGYSGGMRRRLDVAIGMVHKPGLLFLDEPTTGLDPQSRAALWEEVSRLAREEGMTVFLTTQYLEEADALADRIGIIDRGQIVAEGTPTQLKAEIGSPSVEVAPCSARDTDTLAELLSRFGAPKRGTRGAVTVQLPGGESELAEIVRLLDQNDVRVETLQLHQPSLDDVFLAKTGCKLEGAGAEALDGAGAELDGAGAQLEGARAQ